MARSRAILLLLCTLVIGAVYGLFRLTGYVVAGVLSLDSGVAAATIAAITTVLVSVASIVYSQRKTKEREIAESHRPQKIELYKRFMDDAVVGALRQAKQDSETAGDDDGLQERLAKFFLEFTADMIVWGSPQVIKAYRDFRNSENNPHILLKMDDVLRAIRKDLGHGNRGIERGNLIALFLTDPEKPEEMLATRS